jgi:hypothetical protein
MLDRSLIHPPLGSYLHTISATCFHPLSPHGPSSTLCNTVIDFTIVPSVSILSFFGKIQIRQFLFYSNATKAVPWLRRLVAGLSPQRPGFDHGSAHMGFVLDKAFPPEYFCFPPVNCIPSVLHYLEKRKKRIIFITGLHNKPQGCGCVRSICCGALTTKKHVANVTFCVTVKHERGT